MKQIIALALLLFMVGSAKQVYSQSWLEELGNKAIEKAKSRTEDKIEEKVEKGIDDIFDGNKKNKSNKKEKSEQQDDNDNAAVNADADGQVDKADGKVANAGGQQQKGQSLEITYAKSDFVPGDEIIFEDLLIGEQLGEFPSRWDLLEGNCEVAKLNGENAIHIGEVESAIEPLMKDAPNYLPDVYTLEFDWYVNEEADKDLNRFNNINNTITIYFFDSRDQRNEFARINIRPNEDKVENVFDAELYYETATDDKRESNGSTTVVPGWNHFALSFNKRAMKIYINGTRLINIPAMPAANRFKMEILPEYIGNGMENKRGTFIRNVRIAKGAVPLYDRMMSDGKFITYGITFDVGKSTIKPESMSEINRIVQLMTENPTLKFSVEGHTDATGNAASNQALSEARSKAIVDKLVELGIAADRLTSVGKGQNTPIADNSTDEGRAKNRRVEFVKQ